MKKFISIVLSLMLIFSASISVFASSTQNENVNLEFEVIRKVEYEDGFMEIVKCNESTYYNKSHDGINLTIEHNANDNEINVKRYTNEDVLESTVKEIGVNLEPLEVINQVVSEIESGTFEFTELIYIEDLIEENNFMLRSKSQVAENELKRVYGTPYREKQVDSDTRNGKTIKLYVWMAFQTYDHWLGTLSDVTDIATAASMFGIEIPIITEVCKVITIGSRVYLEAKQAVHVYQANVSYDKIARYNGQQKYITDKTITGKVIDGRNGVRYQKDKTRANWDYDKHSEIFNSAFNRI